MIHNNIIHAYTFNRGKKVSWKLVKLVLQILEAFNFQQSSIL